MKSDYERVLEGYKEELIPSVYRSMMWHLDKDALYCEWELIRLIKESPKEAQELLWNLTKKEMKESRKYFEKKMKEALQ